MEPDLPNNRLPDRLPDRRPSIGVRLGRALGLRCPECGRGRLFAGRFTDWFTMADACDHCGLEFAREQGFYIGSIYFNYGATVLATGALYAAVVLGFGRSHEVALTACLAAAVCLPILLFRHARSLLLSLDCAVNRGSHVRPRPPVGGEQSAAKAGVHGEEVLSSFRADDASAGYAMGFALVLIILFGLAMAAVTLVFIGAEHGPIEQL